MLVLLAAGLALPARAQDVTWERLPVIADFPTDVDPIGALGFLRGEGPAAADPPADTLVAVTERGVFLYNPSGAAGAAGANGDWGAWHRLFAGARTRWPRHIDWHDPRRLRRRCDAA